jgi:predicted nucleic-acid-binding protein
VLCELVWVLRDAYGVERGTVAATLEKILDTAQFVIEDRDLARRALADYRQGPRDFSDYLIGWRNRQAGCSETATFDRALRRSELFRLV